MKEVCLAMQKALGLSVLFNRCKVNRRQFNLLPCMSLASVSCICFDFLFLFLLPFSFYWAE